MTFQVEIFRDKLAADEQNQGLPALARITGGCVADKHATEFLYSHLFQVVEFYWAS